MRPPRILATLDEVERGDHVCSLLDPADGLLGSAAAFVADGALFGDKVLVVGPDDRRFRQPDLVFLDPARLEDSLLAAVRREADTADRQGFRSVRILREVTAGAPGVTTTTLLPTELALDEFAADRGAMVVCAYQQAQWTAPTLDQVLCVHPQSLGTRPPDPGFRLFVERGCWNVAGVIDSEGAPAFGAALRAVVAEAVSTRLDCSRLEMIDAAGMRALLEAARHLPHRKVVLHSANETVQLCWQLAGYDEPDSPVVIAP
ncbi:MEDS domain-containing protein [Streptomyces sp. NPDC005805]|uniref:MEDS domain-containing protein n=1 Tax=Streptomyces sp. NPDC005805 TaxID=3157068 RepID=UPI0033DA4AA7